MAVGGVLVGRGYVSIRPEFEGDWSRRASTHANRAGSSAGSGFARAFGGAVSKGLSTTLKSTAALAGVAVAGSLQATAAAAAVLAPALTTAASGAGALALGLKGVGDAFSAAFEGGEADAKAAAAATRAVESAQKNLAKAQRAVADARVAAAERVRDAQRNLADAERAVGEAAEQAADRQKEARQRVRDAERDLASAQRDARNAQQDLTDARRDATRSLEDMNARLADAQLDQREATARLQQAQEKLQATIANPAATQRQREEAQLTYDRAKLNADNQRRNLKRLEADTAKANKTGVNGSEQVVRARERIANADQQVADRQRALTRAQEQSRRAGVDGARAIADAQRDLGDAQRAVDKARTDGARQVADAQEAVADATQALADAQANAAAQTSKLDEAMAALAPNARAFVRAVQGVAPAWDDMRLSVQNRLFAGLGQEITSLARQTLPTLEKGLVANAGALNAMAKSAMGAVAEMQRTGMLEEILAGSARNLVAIKDVPGQFVTMLGQLSVAAQPAFERLSSQFAGAMTRGVDALQKGLDTGTLEESIGNAIGLVGQFGTLLGEALGFVNQIFKASADAGAQIITVLADVFAELRKAFASPEMQTAMKQLFGAVADIVKALLPAVSAIVKAIVPLLAAIAPPIARIAELLGPVLANLVTTLGAALKPVIEALMPVIEMVAVGLIQVVQALTPLLKPISDLITAIIQALAPALQPVIAMIVELVRVLVGPLTTIIEAITPAIAMVGDVLGQVMREIQPVIKPIAELLGQVAQMLAEAFATALKEVLSALRPLIPVGIMLVRTVIAALMPLLPIIGQVLKVIAQAFAMILPPLAGVVKELVSQLAPVLKQLAPQFGQLARILIEALMAVLPHLVTAFMQLVKGLLPIVPLIGQILKLVVNLGADMIKALIPAAIELARSMTQLMIALLPLLPPLTQLITLSLRLATRVLSFLLPILGRFARFVVGALAAAFAFMIRRISSVISIIASLIKWVRDRLSPVFRFFRDKVIRPVWDWIGNKIRDVWQKRIRPAFDAIKRGVDRVKDAFEAAQKGIGKAWNKIKDGTKKPIKWVIENVYNDGIVEMWKMARKVLPIPELKKMSLKGWSSGGYTGDGGKLQPAGIVHRGEFVTQKSSTAAIQRNHPGALDYMNRTGRLPGYAKGGVVGHHGGIGDWFGGKVKQLGGLLNKAKDWVLGGVAKAAAAAAKPIRDLISKVPGATGGWGKLVRAVPRGIINAVIDRIKGSESEQMGDGEWVKPVNAPYGTRFGVAGRMWSSGRHTGLDIPAKTGTAVKAVAGGSISYVRAGGPYGRHILLSHGGGLSSLYAHLSSTSVESGAVRQGQRIGAVGATGNVTGPHLHLEARRNGRPVDPMPFLTGGGGAAGGSGGKGVARWRGTVHRALDQVGQPRSMTNTTLRRMNQESGGNPTIVNRWDSNWKAGMPSVGLMQVIRPTYRAYAGRYRNTGPFSYGVSTNPLANIYSSMRYALSRYGSLPRAYNRPGGYATGGTPRAGEWAWVGEQGPELMRFGSTSRVLSNRDSERLVARGGDDPTVLVGDLYLDSGEFLGKVRGVVRSERKQQERQLTTAVYSRRKGV